MKTLILFLTFFAGTDEELIKAAGGSLEELRAVLYLGDSRTGMVKAAMDAARPGYKKIQQTERQSGTDAADRERAQWTDRLRQEIRGCLDPMQVKRYDAWLQRKTVWASEYDKVRYDLPPVTRIRTAVPLTPAVEKAMRRVADRAVKKIRTEIASLKQANFKKKKIKRAVDDLHRRAIQDLGAAAGKYQRAVKTFCKPWLQNPESRLSGAQKSRLNRAMRSLSLKDGKQIRKIREKVVGILLHEDQIACLRRGLAKQIYHAILRRKSEADVWRARSEHQALMKVHKKRIKKLRGKLQKKLATNDIGKLVAEGILN